MVWATLLLVLISGYVAFELIKLRKTKGRLKYLGLTIAAILLTLIQLSLFINGFTESETFANITSFITEWGHITCLAFVLSSLAVFIRESKPVFAQFPLLYTALPLLIIVSYLLVKDTYALKNWLLTIYQGGAIAVALLMYSVYTYRRSEYLMILLGVTLFLAAYLFFWFNPFAKAIEGWLWKILVAAALWLTVTGYEKTEAIADQLNHSTQNTNF
ncbi:hypothetical protein LX73_0523 [Fodinibius salinus]|uniref:Uncharacterized protein n=1 Tax=Fodinibius salinus TaxID=860790 RepID=A0A5D3YN58_9BACT|nr:hypothetical protein [Fodinibius salinus]TYP95227.1 hypothetical protein LX73_0523 [Fodinibius salinus]